MNVPDGWKNGKIRDCVGLIESGASVNGDDRPLEHQEQGVLKVSAVSSGIFIPSAVKAVWDTEKGRIRTPVKQNSILFARASGSAELVGANAFVNRDFSHLFLSDKIWQIQASMDSETLWLFYLINTIDVREKILNSSSGGSGMKNVSQNNVLDVDIIIPPLFEQRKIAAILSTWDDSLSTLARLIDTKRQQKRALAEQLLTGKRRLNIFEGEWSRTPLGSLIKIKSKELAGKKEYPLLSVTTQGIKYQNVQFNKRIASEKTDSYLILRRGEIAMSGLNFWLGSIGMLTFEEAGIISPDYKIFIINETAANSNFVRHLVRSELMKQILINSSVQRASLVRRNLQMGTFLGSHLALPSLPEQQAIADILSALDDEIEILTHQQAKLQEQKRGLMDLLLTGKVRVQVHEEVPA